MEVGELIDWCKANNRKSITVEKMEDLLAQETISQESSITDDAIDCLCEMMSTHQRSFSPLEQKLIETGVVSGRCFVCWHENKYYPGVTVDNLRLMGFEKFYETYKGNWDKIKQFRKELTKKNYCESANEY